MFTTLTMKDIFWMQIHATSSIKRAKKLDWKKNIFKCYVIKRYYCD